MRLNPFLVVLLLLAAPSTLFADEAAFSFSQVLPWVWLALGTALSAFVVPKVIAFLQARAEAARLEAKNEDLTFKQTLVARVKDYLWSKAAKLADDNLPKIAAKVKAGELASVDAVKAELRSLGYEVRSALATKFGHEGYDVEALLGQATVADLVDRAAAAANIPGRSTSQALLDPAVVETLVSSGMAAFRK